MAQKGNTIIVTYVSSDGPRLKIWGIVDKQNFSYVDEIIGVLSNKFDQHQGLPGSQTPVLPNSICCVKYRGSYVRAKICNLQQNGVFLHLIDSGNYDCLPMDLIRLLYPNSEEETLLLSIHPLAVEFTLANVVSISERWESRCIETIQSFIQGKELEVSHYDKHNSGYLVKLVFSDQDIGNMLVNKRMAKMATLEEMYKPNMYSQQLPYKVPTVPHQHQMPVKENPTNGYSDIQHVYNAPQVAQIPVQQNPEQESWRFNQQAYAYQQNHLQQNLIQRNMVPQKQEVTQEPEPGLLEFRGRLLEVGSPFRVFVSCIEDGPSLFSVQIGSMKDELKQLMSEIQSQEPTPLKGPPLPGSVCLARLKNGCLCRAVVMSTMETQIKIYYVDFGHTESVNYTDIYQLPPKFINPKVLSIRFCLTGLKEMNITDEVKEYFSQLVQAKEVELIVCEPEGPFLIQYGEIIYNGRNIKDYLKERFPDIASISYGNLPPLTDGTKETVYVSFVTSCSRFFVQLEKNLKDIDEMMAAVYEYAATAPQMKQLHVGSICIAPYEVDKQWYRVKILKINGDKVNVLYVDYGNEETVSVNQLRAIRKDLVTQLPSQAILCVLNGYQNRASNKSLDTQFESLTFEKRLSMFVKNAQPSHLIVDLFDITTTPPKNILIELNKSSTDSSNVFNDSTSSKKSEEIDRNLSQNYQRSDGKEQPIVVQRQKTKSKGAKTRDEMEVSKTSVSSLKFRSNNDENSRSKSKSWKDDHNEQRHDNRYQWRDDNERFNREGGNDQSTSRDGRNTHFNRGGGNNSFNRDDGANNSFNRDSGFNRNGGNDRFNRDGGNDRFNRDTGSNRVNREGNDRFNRDGTRNDRNNFRDGGRFIQNENNRDDRNSGNRFASNKRDQSYNSDKHASDNESIASSRGSGKRGERGGFQGRKERDNRPNRFNKPGGRDNESGNFRPRGNEYNSGNNFKSKNARDDGFDKPKEMINFNTNTDFSKSKKYHIPELSLMIGSTHKCELVYLTNPSNFYIHLVKESLKLDELMEKIASVYEKGGMILESSNVKPDLVCIAQYSEDEKWYRAIIKSIENTTVNVLFIDYGNLEKVNFNKLKEINDEFTLIPIQAIPCKLFGVKKTEWTSEEIDSFADATNGKYMQIEFVKKDKDVFQVLLREEENEVIKQEFINELFCQRMDLMRAKEALENIGKISSGNLQKNQLEFASKDSRWNEEKVSPGKKEAVLVTWFDNPEKFYCQSIKKQQEFRPMMEEIQKVYVKRQPVSDSLIQPGYPVIAVFAQDRALYRAEIVEVKANQNHIIQYVDFGNRATVDQRNMFPVEKRFMVLPKQAIRCSLKNIIPANGDSWSNVNSHEIEKYLFDADEFDCTYHEEKDDRYLVSLSNNGIDVAGSLVEKKLALFSVSSSTPTIEKNTSTESADIVSTPRFDIKLLPGQTLRAKVSNVESVSKFYLQFSSAEDCEEKISSFMKNADPKVMPRLSSHEICLGAGCLVLTDGVWRRGVVVNCSITTSFDVRLIDTGSYKKMSLDCMLSLPSQLSVMQNQAIECSLHNIQPSSLLNEKLKNLVENKDVIIYVEEVDNNRLIVQLYDPLGGKIRLTNDEKESNISPICPMPILNSTHKVNVSCAHHSNSLWLQMSSDIEKDEKLNREMLDFYSEERESLLCPEPNRICAVENEDVTSRAMIIKKTDRGVLVNLIDYGEYRDISCDKLKVLDPRFFIPHQLAIHVSLNVTLRGTPAEQIEALKPHLQGKEFTATFYNVHKKWIVELIENNVKLSETLASMNLVKETTTMKTEKIKDIVVGGKFKVIVSHMDSPGQFWMQRFEEISLLNELQNELQNSASNYPAVDKVLEEGSLCAVISDGIWYRAKVIDADEDITSVRFIDYGKTDVINNKPGNIKELPDSIKMKKAYGIKYRLDVIPVDSEDWSDITCEWLQNLLKSSENLEAILIAESVPKRVDLFINGKSVIDILVEEGNALRVHHEEELVEEIVEVELDPRSAFISHIASPNEFFVQEEKSVSDLEKIQDRFLIADMLPKVDNIMEGLFCVAKYIDNNWYRARVISQNEIGTEVLFIDYGNTAVVTEIRAIPEDVASIPPLSRKCSLQMPNYVSQWPKNVVEIFDELAADGATIFLMDVLQEGETTMVKLTLQNEDIAEKLAPPRSIFISHINSPTDFWIQEEKNVSEIEEIQEKLLDADNYPEVEVKEGLICVAKFSDDEQWYRAKVLSQNENDTIVLFIDYGNSTSSTEIRALPENLKSIAPFAKKCSLKLPNYADEWPQDAFDNFVLLAEDGNVTFFLDVVEEAETAIVNLLLGKESIAEKLVPRVSEETVEERVIEKDNVSEGETKSIGTVVEKDVDIVKDIAIIENSLVSVYISHLDSISEFWVQEEKASDDIQKIGDSLVDSENFSQLNEVKNGVICAAKFPDDSCWYRAKILSQDDNGIIVSFIDYGNSSVVTDIRALPEDIATVPALAKKCSLKLPLKFKKWQDDALNEFLKLSCDGTTCFAMKILEDGETLVVNLYLNGESIAEKLASCDSEEISTEESIVLAKESDVLEKDAIIEAKCVDPVIEDAVTEEECSVLEKEDITEEKCDIVEKDSLISEKECEVLEKEGAITGEEPAVLEKEGVISEEKCAIPEKECEVLEKESAITEEKSAILEKESIVSEKESEVSEKESAITEDECRVLEKEGASSEEKCAIPEKECEILEKESAITEEKSAILEKESIVSEKESEVSEKESVITEDECRVLEKEDAISVEKSAIPEKESIIPEKEDTVSENESTIPENVPLSTQESEPPTEKISLKPVSIFISHLNCPKEFWVQEEKSTGKLEEIGEKLLDNERYLKVEEPKEGLICAALFPDDQAWYRAKIISHNEKETIVCFIDYGNISSVTELRLLPDDLVNVPPLSKKCSLKLPFEISEWPQEATQEFKNYSAEGTSSFLMEILEEGDSAIVDLKLNDKSIADELFKQVEVKETIDIEPRDSDSQEKRVESSEDELKKTTADYSETDNEDSQVQKVESDKVLIIDLTESDTDTSLKEIVDQEKTLQGSQDSVSHSEEVDPASLSRIKEESKDSTSSLQESNKVDADSTIPLSTADEEKQTTSKIDEELVVDEINERIICEAEENIESCHQTIAPDSISEENNKDKLPETEISNIKIERHTSIPDEDKIITGSICKDSDLLENESESSNKSEPITGTKSIPEPLSLANSGTLLDNGIEEGSIKVEEPLVLESTPPLNLKTSNSEKIVENVANLSEKLVEVKMAENIPQ